MVDQLRWWHYLVLRSHLLIDHYRRISSHLEMNLFSRGRCTILSVRSNKTQTKTSRILRQLQIWLLLIHTTSPKQIHHLPINVVIDHTIPLPSLWYWQQTGQINVLPYFDALQRCPVSNSNTFTTFACAAIVPPIPVDSNLYLMDRKSLLWSFRCRLPSFPIRIARHFYKNFNGRPQSCVISYCVLIPIVSRFRSCAYLYRVY